MSASNVISLPEADADCLRLTPGEYTAVYVRHAGMNIFRSIKLRIDFRIVEHYGVILPRWYRVTDCRGGRIRADRHGDLVRELSTALRRRVRHDRVPVTLLADMLLRVSVRDVIVDRKQQALADVNQYSVVDRLLGPAQ